MHMHMHMLYMHNNMHNNNMHMHMYMSCGTALLSLKYPCVVAACRPPIRSPPLLACSLFSFFKVDLC